MATINTKCTKCKNTVNGAWKNICSDCETKELLAYWQSESTKKCIHCEGKCTKCDEEIVGKKYLSKTKQQLCNRCKREELLAEKLIVDCVICEKSTKISASYELFSDPTKVQCEECYISKIEEKILKVYRTINDYQEELKKSMISDADSQKPKENKLVKSTLNESPKILYGECPFTNLFNILKEKLPKRDFDVKIEGDSIRFGHHVEKFGYAVADNGKHIFVVGPYGFFDAHNENQVTRVGYVKDNKFEILINSTMAEKFLCILSRKNLEGNVEEYCKQIEALNLVYQS